jgi:hypothetical protein
LTRLGNPSDFWRESLKMVLFFFECLLSDEHWEVAILDT